MILLQNTLLLSGLVMIFLTGLISHTMAESDEEYLKIKEIYNEQRWNLEKEFKEKFIESSDTFEQQKQDIYEKSKSDTTVTAEQTAQMLRDTFSEFLERQKDIKEEYASRVNALNEMFAEKFKEFDTIPAWVKNVMALWNEGKISDAEYVNFLSFLIDNKIIETEQLLFPDYQGYVMLIKSR